MMQTYLKENPMIALGVLLLAGSMFMKYQSGDFQKQSELGAKVKAARFDVELQNRLLEVSQDATKNRATIAEDRYRSGCVMVFSSQPDKQGYFTALSPGQPVMDSSRKGATLGDGNVVCDANGLTGVIVGGVVTDTAFTPNRQAVADAMKRYDGKPSGSVKYAAPNQ